jgi:hypothetical protein
MQVFYNVNLHVLKVSNLACHFFLPAARTAAGGIERFENISPNGRPPTRLARASARANRSAAERANASGARTKTRTGPSGGVLRGRAC